jgi:hypothetical protein
MPPFFVSNPEAVKNALIKLIIRIRFRLSSTKRVENQTRRLLADYLDLTRGLDERSGNQSVRVPPMLGVDEDMRDWSFLMILQHNTIVNHAISDVVRRLALGEPEPEKKFDPKTDTVPDSTCGMEEVTRFEESVRSHLALLPTLGKLRGTAKAEHPIFGPFDAHMWSCLFPFHLQIHMKQAAFVRNAVLES